MSPLSCCAHRLCIYCFITVQEFEGYANAAFDALNAGGAAAAPGDGVSMGFVSVVAVVAFAAGYFLQKK
jgi:hypothetical protein